MFTISSVFNQKPFNKLLPSTTSHQTNNGIEDLSIIGEEELWMICEIGIGSQYGNRSCHFQPEERNMHVKYC